MTSSLRTLTSADFEAPEKNVMYLRYPGVVFVLFKKKDCKYCGSLYPILTKLSQDRRLMWGIADVGDHRQIVAMSNTTNTPIKGVPMMILYVNGRPHAVYNGNRTIEDIAAFINHALSPPSSVPQPKAFVNAAPRGIAPISNESMFSSSQPSKLPNPPSQSDTTVNIPNDVIPYNTPYKKLFNTRM